ncbi:GAF domain-containing sensor histidine kinase [Aureimonas fodinaquatilis]|uniref:histidine kinase n=2 Tax=Aureimonas fodinaquatilis TaxID=2565783 RepID=A0A5B0E5I8_9HYPH|nr:GAF domain-containing sensor histidine kinase [Aureimonas fodinaquatilis]
MLDVVCRMTGMGAAAVGRVTESRWIACAVQDSIGLGLKPGSELPLETTLCNEVRQSRDVIVIEDVQTDNEYCNHHTPRMYGFRSYISVPITLEDGSFFGTLCALHGKPVSLKTPGVLGMFNLFAELIGFHIDSKRRYLTAETKLAQERETGLLREQFIAILGHDLRNPLASIHSGARLLARSDLAARDREIVELVQGSVIRMSGLIDNILDFARGRLGGGIELDLTDSKPLESVLEQVIEEFRVVHPSRTILPEFKLDVPVSCDASRIGQLLSNLVANALTHGDADGAIHVSAHSDTTRFCLQVRNKGAEIPEELRQKLFQPFVRPDSSQKVEGLGLGLFIASEIAKAHDGSLEMHQSDGTTCFSLIIPIRSL